MNLSDLSLVKALDSEREMLLGALRKRQCQLRIDLPGGPWQVALEDSALSAQAWPLARVWLTKRIAEVEAKLALLGVTVGNADAIADVPA